MTKFGKFKLRLIATINMGVLLSIFNIASTASNYWVKLPGMNNGHHSSGYKSTAGLWKTCGPSGDCEWRNGIVDHVHSFWSYFVRSVISLGTVINVFAVLLLLTAFLYKLNKKSKRAIQIMEWVNCMLMFSLIILLVGFCVFVSSSCNFSLWLHVGAMCLMAITSNMLTRTFAALYFKNTRLGVKSCDMACSTVGTEPDEKTALNEENNQVTLEMHKIDTGSKEALIQTGDVQITATGNTETQEGVNPS